MKQITMRVTKHCVAGTSAFILAFLIGLYFFDFSFITKSVVGRHNEAAEFASTRESSKGSKTSEHAFVTLLAGFDPDNTKPLGSDSPYLGYLLHLATVRFMLDEAGAKSDVIVMVRILNGINHTTLPKSQETYLSKLGMRIKYLHPGEWESFNSWVMEKFRILDFSEYKRVLFFDADVLPQCNWDHYVNVTMDNDDGSIFAPNLVFAFRNEPSQAGFFVMAPEPGAWEAIRQLRFINTTHSFGIPLEYPAEGGKEAYTEWSWYCVHVDQGIMYHWLRYVKKDVTIFNRNRVQRWKWNGSATVLREIRDFPFTCPNHIDVAGEGTWGDFLVTHDFIHYTGNSKPWKHFNWSHPVDLSITRPTRHQIWPYALRMAWQKYDLGLVRDLFPNLLSNRDIEMVDGFLSRNFSTGL